MPKLSTPKDLFVSVVLLTDQDSKDVAKMVTKVYDVLQESYDNYEILLIDNNIRAREYRDAVELLDKIPCIRIIRLSQTLTKDVCVFVGLESAIGDVVAILSSKDPTKLLTKFILKAYDSDLVFGISKTRTRTGSVNHYGAKIFYWYNKRFLNISIPENATYFMALSRRAVNALTRSKRHARHIRYMARRIGYSEVEVSYKPSGDYQPEKKPVHKLMLSALELSTNYSNHPLRLVSTLGFVASFLNLVYAGYVIIVKLVKDNVAQGWTTLSLQSAIMFFFVFAILGVICEYIGQILQETQDDPSYHITEELSSRVSVADMTRRNIIN